MSTILVVYLACLCIPPLLPCCVNCTLQMQKHIYCLYTLLKSCWLLRFECSVHVSDGFPKKSLDGGGWVG